MRLSCLQHIALRIIGIQWGLSHPQTLGDFLPHRTLLCIIALSHKKIVNHRPFYPYLHLIQYSG
jgi:hypothetical protein